MLRLPTSLSRVVLLLAALTVLIGTNAATYAQADKRPLDHSDYDRWNTIAGQQISNDGKWVLYTIRSGKRNSDAILKIRHNGTNKEYSIVRAGGAKFTFDSRFIVYRVTPDKKKVKELQKAKVGAENMPGTVMEILELESGNRFNANRVRSFQTPRENSQWVGYLLDKQVSSDSLKQQNSKGVETLEVTPEGLKKPTKKLKLKKRKTESPEESTKPNAEESKTKQSKPKESKESPKKETSKSTTDKKSDDVKKTKQTGTTLVLRDLHTGLERSYPNVVRFWFSKNGARLAFTTSVKPVKKSSAPPTGKSDKKKDKPDPAAHPTDGVYVVDLDTLVLQLIATGEGEYKSLAFNEDGSQLAYLSNQDDYKTKTSSWSVFHWKARQKSAAPIADESSQGIPDAWWIAPVSNITFSKDSTRIYFDTAPVPESVEKERKDAKQKSSGKKVVEKEEEPKAKLDLWHWQDPQLQPQQLLQAAAERRRSYRAVYNLKSKKIFQLATKEIPFVRIDPRSTASLTIASSNMRYRKMLSWDTPGFQDTYLIDLDTGERELLLEKSKFAGRLSTEGKYITWFDSEQKKWFAVSTGDDRTPVEISSGIEHALQNELHDTPSLPRSYGSAGWLKDDAAFLIYDRFDIWQLDPTGSIAPICITGNQGRENKIRFRGLRLDPEARSVDPSLPVYLSAFDETTKASGFYRLNLTPEETKASAKTSQQKSDDSTAGNDSLKRLIMLDERISRLSKAKNTEDVIFNRSTFRDCPDIWSSKTAFKKIQRISDINPQQDNYLWGTAELVHWNATDGQALDGLLLKPDGFDPNKKYPMMVYFYERNSDNLHAYYAPAAGRSIINHSFYVSRGYVVFIPDIPYKTGEPGPSAANAILPGVEHLVEQGFINEKKIGMQGHSWGGYQTAYLVTQTDMFACAESGAPVSNMTSAYGGIRWASGMSRMFQYERTQSRIGEDLWAARDKYIANSPVFFADKINTPLLILHNDNDGAVPWYQGIELFVALRRLERQAWLINYNGQPHGISDEADRRDFAVRMQQFFDHYLQDAPEPEWMAYGLPAVDKGKKFGLDLLEPESEATKGSEESKATEEK